MARADFDAQGNPARLAQTPDEEARYPQLPNTTAETFDAATNAPLIAAFLAGTLRRVGPGALTIGGTPAPIAADSPDEADRKALRAAALVNALLAGTATNAQVQGALGRLIRSLARQGVIG